MDAIPEELLMEILRRVPKKSRCRSKCVSKQWLNLISAELPILYSSSPTRTTTWGLGFKKRDGSMIFCRLDEKGRLTVDGSVVFSYPREYSRRPNIMGSCNGWLYICSKFCPDLGFNIRYFLYNPITKQSVMLPRLLDDPLSNPWPWIHFRPAGLGFTFYDDIDACGTNNWKFVVILQDLDYSIKESRKLIISLFDSSRWAWETRPASFTKDSDLEIIPCYTIQLGDSSIYINGVLHWVLKSCLVLFSFNTWSFRIIKLPDAVNGEMRKGLLWRSEGGRLNYCHAPSKQGLCIWILEKKDEDDHIYSWRMTCSVSIHDLRSMLPEIISECHPNICPYAVNEELQLIHLKVDKRFACLDLAEKTLLPLNLPSGCGDAEDESPSWNPFICWKFKEPADRQPKLTKLGVTKKIAKTRRSLSKGQVA